jgi:hypothetical protein
MSQPHAPSDSQRLRVLLESEAELYARMRDLLQEEREVLFSLDAERLQALALQKAELADEGRVLENGRQAVTAQLAGSLGVPTEGLRLRDLCDLVGSQDEALRAAHNRLVILVSVVRELMDANRYLAGQSLADVRATIDSLGGLLDTGVAYGRDGALPANSGRLVRRSA